MPASFSIVVSEEQRVALLSVLRAASSDPRFSSLFDCLLRSSENPHGFEGPLSFWVEMLEGLPSVEAETPGALHGFCL